MILTDKTILYDYPKSSASYRLRIALNLKGIIFEKQHINLLDKSHQSPKFRAINPQGLVPILQIDGMVFTQSLAIIEYLDESRPDKPLLPKNIIDRTKARALAHAIAMEIHPICNLSVAQHVMQITDGDNETKTTWMQHFIQKGLMSFEAMLANINPSPYCFDQHPGIVECTLMPQLYNAHRWGVSLDDMPLIRAIELACNNHPSFIQAHPDAL